MDPAAAAASLAPRHKVPALARDEAAQIMAHRHAEGQQHAGFEKRAKWTNWVEGRPVVVRLFFVLSIQPRASRPADALNSHARRGVSLLPGRAS